MVWGFPDAIVTTTITQLMHVIAETYSEVADVEDSGRLGEIVFLQVIV